MPERNCEIDILGLVVVLVCFFLYSVVNSLAQVR